MCLIFISIFQKKAILVLFCTGPQKIFFSNISSFLALKKFKNTVTVCSVTRGVKKGCLLCISIKAAYGQCINTGSNPQIHNWLTSGGSILLLPSSVLDLHTGLRILSQPHTVAHGCWANLLPLQMLSDQILSLPLSLLWTGRVSVLGLSRRSLQRLTHPIRVWILPY